MNKKPHERLGMREQKLRSLSLNFSAVLNFCYFLFKKKVEKEQKNTEYVSLLSQIIKNEHPFFNSESHRSDEKMRGKKA